MKKLLLVLWLVPSLALAQNSDTLFLTSPGGNLFGIIVNDFGQLQVIPFGTRPSVKTGPSVGFKYSKIVAKATASGYTLPSPSMQQLQQKYFNKLDSIGFLHRCDFFYVFVNDGNKEFGLLNWADPDHYEANPINSPLYNPNRGFSGGNNGYLETGYNPALNAVRYTADSASFGGYAVGISNGSGFNMGVNTSGDAIVRLKSRGTGMYRINNGVSDNFVSPADSNGFFAVNKKGDQINFSWKGQVLDNSQSTTAILPSEQFYILCQNLGGMPNSYSSTYMAIAFAGGNIGDIKGKVTQYTEDYMAAVRQFYGLPPLDPATQRSRALAKEDINSVIDIRRGHESEFVNGHLLVKDLYAMLDTSEVNWTVDGKINGLSVLDPRYGWDVRFEDMKQGFKNPVEGIIEWNHPTAIDSIALWQGNNLKDTNMWFDFFASNDYIHWVPIAQKISYSYIRQFTYLKSENRGKFRYFKVVRQNNDPNGQANRVVHNFLKIIPIGRQDEYINYIRYKSMDSLHISKYTFAETMGVSAYTVDSIKDVTTFKNISQFNNFKRYMARPGDPWGAMLNYFSAYSTIYSNGIKFKGPDGRPVRMLRGGLEDVYEAWRDNGVDFVFERFQLNSNAWLADSLNQYYVESSIRDTTYLTSDVVYVTDRKYSLPKNIRGEPQTWVDTITLQRNLAHYDFRKALYDAYDSSYYPNNGKFSDYLISKYREKDSTGNETGRVNSIINFMRISPQAMIAMADPKKRFQVLTDPETYMMWGDFIFNYTAVTGRNKNIPPEDVYVIKGDSTLIGLDIVDAESGENEADRDWQGGLAQMPDYAIGMMLSVQYDGHLGLVGGIRGNHAVGIRTADSTMKMVIHSLINSDLNRAISAVKWAEYFRARDMWRTTGKHPYNGMPLTVKMKNIAFDFHEYRSTAGGQGSGVLSTSSIDHALTPELSRSTDEMMEGLRIIRTLWPDYEVYCSEYGYGHLEGGNFAERKEMIGIKNPATNNYDMDPDYDLTYAQASDNDWDSMFRHGFLEKIFIYRLKDGDNYYAKIDTNTIPYSIDRQAVWNQSPFTSSFVSHGLYTHTLVARRRASIPKPAAYSIKTLLSVIGNSYQLGYEKNEQDSVAMFKYFDFTDNYWTYAIRRYSNHNGKTYNYTVKMPKGVKNVTRIEPVRNQPALTTINLGKISSYTTTVSEKYFLLKIQI